jgi:hypothetical protein
MRTVTLAALLTLTAGGMQAQATLPSGTEVYQRHLTAIGGREGILAHRARTVWARVEVPTQGIRGPLVIYSAAPDKMFTRTEIPGIGEVTSGFDGETGWAINPALGPLVMDGLALNQMKQQADFYGPLTPEKHIEALETVGEETFEGTACYKVRIKTRWGEEYVEYFDKATGLHIGTQRKQSTPMGEVDATTVISDYKSFAGIRIPGMVRLRLMGIEQVVTMDSMSTAPIADSMFTLPAQIKAIKK